jgi:hypothetical protein
MRHPEVIEDSCYHGVNDLLDGLGAGVKGGVGRQNGGSREHEQLEIFHVNEVERRLARDENKLLFLLQYDVGGAKQNVLAKAMSYPAKGAHAAWDNNHGIGGIRAAGKRGVHTLEIVGGDAFGQPQAIRQFLDDDGLSIIAQNRMDLMRGAIKIVQQTLSVKQTAGAGNGNEYSQGQRILAVNENMVGCLRLSKRV